VIHIGDSGNRELGRIRREDGRGYVKVKIKPLHQSQGNTADHDKK